MPGPTAENLLEFLSSDTVTSLLRPKEAREAIQEILSILHEPGRSGGLTYNRYFGDQWGQPFYAVGLNNDWTEDLDPERLEYALDRFLRTHQVWLKNPRCCLGVWEGSIQGQRLVVLDISVLVYHEEVARRFGREGNQVAIFSLGNGREIATEGTGESNEARLRRLEREDRITLPLGEDDE